MKSSIADLALFGGTPAFGRELPVGQMYFPSWDRYERAMRGIFDRQWYTNNGPLARELEVRLAEFLGVRNVLCVSNATVGLMVAAKALALDGTVILPAFTFPASAQALVWAGASPRFCDIGAHCHHVTCDTIDAALDSSVQAILAVNLWGDTCDVPSVASMARGLGVPLFIDSAQAFGCRVDGKSVGGFGAVEAFSFHATKVLNGAEGGCLSTNDDDLADTMRNIRSSYGVGRRVKVPVTLNGRFSEAQAALATMALDDYEQTAGRNRELLEAYIAGLAPIPGLRMRAPMRAEDSNCQYCVCEVDQEAFGLTRDDVLALLKAENVNARRHFYPGLHRTPPFSDELGPDLPRTDQLCQTVAQLPLGALVTVDDIRAISRLLTAFRELSGQISVALRRRD